VLTGLWATDDYISEFVTYVGQLGHSIESVFSQDTALLRTQGRSDVMRLLHILRGVARSLMSNRTFNLFFDWFYPQYL